MGDLGQLIAEGLVQFRHGVAERGEPKRGDGVEVAVAVDVDELSAFAALDDDRPVVGVGRHLGEAMPHHRGIAFDPTWEVSHGH